MLKMRVIPCLDVKDGRTVKGVNFVDLVDAGDPVEQAKIYDEAGADELCFLDITASHEDRGILFDVVTRTAEACFMPLTVGGGVRTLDQVGKLLAVGADKVAVNTAAVERPEIVGEIAKKYGAQCCVVSIDFRGREVVTRSGRKPTGLSVVEHAKKVAALGAGEILLTSVERDGEFTGYDLDVTRAVSEAVNIPVIASGGCGKYQDMADVLSKAKASAVAAASIFHFTEATPLEAKQFLGSQGFAVRS